MIVERSLCAYGGPVFVVVAVVAIVAVVVAVVVGGVGGDAGLFIVHASSSPRIDSPPPIHGTLYTPSRPLMSRHNSEHLSHWK